MAKFTKYNNPNRRKRRKISRTDADILAAKAMFDDHCRGIDLSPAFYDHMSDQMCGKTSRQR